MNCQPVRWCASTVDWICHPGETRCYCNEAGCVSTGYMCKSTRLGACFSQLSRDGPTNIRSTHGCVESLPEVEYNACVRVPDEHVMSSAPVGRPVLICCKSDMCNYMDSVGINGFFRRRQDGSIVAGAATKQAQGKNSLWIMLQRTGLL